MLSLVGSRSHDIYNVIIALKFDTAVESPVKFQSDLKILAFNLEASRLREIWRWYCLCLVMYGVGQAVSLH